MYKIVILLLLSLQFTSIQGNKEVWIEIHDASPGYGTEKLEEVVTILDRHDVEKKMIFVIPNHNNITPLSKYPEFSRYLKRKETEGYIIGMHGYTHRGFEFLTTREKAEGLIEASETEFNTYNIKTQAFNPPRYLVTRSSLDVLKKHFNEVYMINKVIIDDRTLPYGMHEFTWFNIDNRITLPLAKLSYLKSKQQVFRVSVHIGKVNSQENLRFLDEFLTWSDHIKAS